MGMTTLHNDKLVIIHYLRIPADLVVLECLYEGEASVCGEYDVPVVALSILDEEQAQLHPFECHVHLEIAALVLAAGLGMAFVHRHQFFSCMLAPVVLVLPRSVLGHADDVQCAAGYLAYALDEVDAVKPAVGQEICRPYPPLP